MRRTGNLLRLALALAPSLILGIGPGARAQLPPPTAAPVELHINPKKASVIVDGQNVGEARDFSSRAYPMWLKFGTHVLQFSKPGYQTLLVKFEVRRGKTYRVHYDLKAGEGIDPRSSKKPQEPPAAPVYD